MVPGVPPEPRQGDMHELTTFVSTASWYRPSMRGNWCDLTDEDHGIMDQTSFEDHASIVDERVKEQSMPTTEPEDDEPEFSEPEFDIDAAPVNEHSDSTHVIGLLGHCTGGTKTEDGAHPCSQSRGGTGAKPYRQINDMIR